MRTRHGISLCLDGLRVYQSYGLSVYRNLGNLETIIDNISRHKIDELLLITPASNPINHPFCPLDFEELSKIHIPIPVLVAGGLESETTFNAYCSHGVVERFVFSGAIYRRNTRWLSKYSRHFGSQAILACLPIKKTREGWSLIHGPYAERPLMQSDLDFAFMHADEVIIQDIGNYGRDDQFDMSVTADYDLDLSRTNINGGVGSHAKNIGEEIGLSAIYFDNSRLHQEGCFP